MGSKSVSVKRVCWVRGVKGVSGVRRGGMGEGMGGEGNSRPKE